MTSSVPTAFPVFQSHSSSLLPLVKILGCYSFGTAKIRLPHTLGQSVDLPNASRLVIEFIDESPPAAGRAIRADRGRSLQLNPGRRAEFPVALRPLHLRLGLFHRRFTARVSIFFVDTLQSRSEQLPGLSSDRSSTPGCKALRTEVPSVVVARGMSITPVSKARSR